MPRKAQVAPATEERFAPGGAAAVDRALSLLAAFRPTDHALTLAEISRRAGLYKSTGQRLLASLEYASFVERLEDGRYALGRQIGRLHPIYRQALTLDRLVIPILRTLVARTGNTAAYHVRRGDTRICLYRVNSAGSPCQEISRVERLPLSRGVGGRILSAFDPELAGRAKGLDRCLYEEIRSRGFHSAIADRVSGVAGISAPVFRSDGSIAASLTLVMPCGDFDQRNVLEVLRLARELTGQV